MTGNMATTPASREFRGSVLPGAFSELHPHLVNWPIKSLSNDVGTVKHDLRTPPHALLEERHFALEDGLRFPTLGPLLIVWGQELSPTQPSLRSSTAIMITSSNFPAKGSGIPNHYVGDLLHTIGISGLSRVRTELVQLAVVQPLTPHPVQMHRQLASHGHVRDLPSSSHGEMKECAAPFGMAAPVTCAASTSRNRSSTLPCLLMCPSRRRSPLDSSVGTNPT